MADNESVPECAVCLENLNTVVANKFSLNIILPCKHVFHFGCVEEWKDARPNRRFSCPLCRVKYSELDMKTAYFVAHMKSWARGQGGLAK
jgi:Ring finger domain